MLEGTVIKNLKARKIENWTYEDLKWQIVFFHFTLYASWSSQWWYFWISLKIPIKVHWSEIIKSSKSKFFLTLLDSSFYFFSFPIHGTNRNLFPSASSLLLCCFVSAVQQNILGRCENQLHGTRIFWVLYILPKIEIYGQEKSSTCCFHFHENFSFIFFLLTITHNYFPYFKNWR